MTEAKPTSTPLPERPGPDPKTEPTQHATPCEAEHSTKSEPQPKLRLHLDDLSHPASSQFLTLVDGARLLPNALSAIRKHLYPAKPTSATSKRKHEFQLPPTRSVTVILRPMDGVAYTTGIDLDSSHKEIHVNLNYIRDCTDKSDRRRHEIIGVITHELVHCYQWDGSGSAPGGLIEGIADFVRLKEGLGPPHWFGEKGRRDTGDKWDAGYQKTAFFLDWLEEKHGLGTVGRINDALRSGRYDEAGFWQSLFGDGKTIKVLWDEYVAAQDPGKEANEKAAVAEKEARPTNTAPEKAGTNRSTTPTARVSHESDDIVVVERE